MKSRGLGEVRWRPIAGVVALLGVWTGLQLWLSHRRETAIHDQLAAGVQRLNAIATARGLPTHPVPPRDPAEIWIHGGEQSLIVAVLLTAVAAALVLGGRRWWAAIVIGVPLANVVGQFQDGTPLGYGWWQEGPTQTWFAVGTFVDAAMLLAVVGLLIRGLPVPAKSGGLSAAGRGVIASVVLATWWVARVETSDPAHRVWAVQAIVFVMAAALLASTALPFTARLAMVVLVLPILGMAFTDDIVFVELRRPTFDSMEFVHHALVAVAVLAYVAGVPALVARSRTRKTSTIGAASTV